MLQRLFPALLWFGAVNRTSFIADIVAGLTSAILVLPQAIAFAAIAGMPIEYGFYTALVTPVIAALFGSSRQMISGPTTAISILLFASLASQFNPESPEYVKAAISLTCLAGLIQLLLGSLRLGVLANFVSPSVMVGFTASAAAIIAYSQFDGFFGMELNQFIAVYQQQGLLEMFTNIATVLSVLIGTIALTISIIVFKYFPYLPAYLIALLIGVSVAYITNASNYAVEFIVLSGNSINQSLIPAFSIPEFDMTDLQSLAQTALALALVGLLEATAIARSIALKTGQEVNINQEFIGQGLSNFISSFFSAYMGSGSFSRSAANLSAGAVTPISAILASLFLLLILLFVRPWINYIPIPAIAGVIILVAWRLVEFEHIKNILKTSPTSSTVMAVTFLSSLIIGLEFGIYIGIMVSMTFFLRRSLTPYLAMTAPDVSTEERYFRNAQAFDIPQCPQLGIGRLDGQLYFGSIEELRRQFRQLEKQNSEQKHLLLLLKGIDRIDMPGAELIIEEAKRRYNRGGQLYITARQRQITRNFKQFNVIRVIGQENVYFSKNVAIKEIVPRLEQGICKTCDKRIFNECPFQK